MVGLGMNDAEMADNPDLDEYVVHDLNLNPELPFADNIFDAVVVTVSVQYMTSPIETFQEVNRILKLGGIFIVTFSNRMFPTKAVRIWRGMSDEGHLDLVNSYMDYAGGFGDIRGGLVNPADQPQGNPLFAVIARKEIEE
jgi:ubiquinone/menaquinone biosynthesis C-methylase UbiE